MSQRESDDLEIADEEKLSRFLAAKRMLSPIAARADRRARAVARLEYDLGQMH